MPSAAALELYVWNAEVSAALATTIGHVEVVLRNAIHENLTAWSRQRFAEPRWYLDPGDIQFTALALVGWICPVSRLWIERRCPVGQVLDRRPA